MSETPNEKIQIDRTGLTVNTDPQADAEKAAKASQSDRGQLGQPDVGVKRIGGGDHGKTDKGVKVVKRI